MDKCTMPAWFDLVEAVAQLSGHKLQASIQSCAPISQQATQHAMTTAMVIMSMVYLLKPQSCGRIISVRALISNRRLLRRQLFEQVDLAG